jgi:hypothetical protein
VLREDIAQFLIDIFPEREQTAVVTKVDGDVITINGTPLLVTDSLKALLLNGENAGALEGAVLKFKSAVRSIQDLSEVEIVRSGTASAPLTLNTTGMPKTATVKLAADHVSLQGGLVEKLVVGEKVSNVSIDADVGKLEISSKQPVTLKGTGTLAEIKITDAGAKVELGKNMKVDKIILPENANVSSVITNLDQVKQSIKNIETDKGNPVQVPSASTPTQTVSQPNRVPVVAHEVDDKAVNVGDGAFTVDLSSVFTDADNDTLTLSAASSATGVATVSLNGTTLTITPVGAGTATVTVTANDGHGGTMDEEFNVTVNQSNRDPVVANELANQTVTAGDGPITVDLSGVFTDADNDDLTLSAVSSETGVATVSVNGTTLTVTPLNAGTTSVTVTANDGNGGTKDETFTVTVDEPVAAAPSLFISETIWGSYEYDLAVEIYNPTGSAVDISQLRLVLPNKTISLVNSDYLTLAPGEVLAVVDNWFYLTEDDITTPEVRVSFEIDPQLTVESLPLQLKYGDQTIDTIEFKKESTMVRKSGITQGSTNYDVSEWTEFLTDDFNHIGTHTP